MNSDKVTKRSSTPPPSKRTSGDLTPSIREKSAQRLITSSLARPRPINQGNDDLVPSINNSIRSNQINISPSTSNNKNKNKNKNKKQTSKTTSTKKHSSTTNQSPTDESLQSSIKFFLAPSTIDGSAKKYEVNSVTPVPSSTVVSTDIAPDPSRSSIISTTRAYANSEATKDTPWDFEDSKKGFIEGTSYQPTEGHKKKKPHYVQVGTLSQDNRTKPLPPTKGDTLESEDLSNYVVQNEEGSPQKLKSSTYFNSWEAHEKEREEDKQQIREQEEEDDIQYYDESENYYEEEGEKQSDTKSHQNHKQSGIFFSSSDDSSSNGSNDSSYSDDSDSTDSDDKKPPATTIGETIEIVEEENNEDSDEENNNFKVVIHDKGETNDKKEVKQKEEAIKFEEYDPAEELVFDAEEKTLKNDKRKLEEIAKDCISSNETDHVSEKKENMDQREDVILKEQKFDGNSSNEIKEELNNSGADHPKDAVLSEQSQATDNINNDQKSDQDTQEGDNKTTKETKEQKCKDDAKNDEEEKVQAKEGEDVSMKSGEAIPEKNRQEEEKEDEKKQSAKVPDDSASVDTEKMGTITGNNQSNPTQSTPSEEQDEIGTINSDQTTHKMTPEEAAKEKVPPMSIRYQHVFDVNTESLKEVDRAFDKDGTSQSSPKSFTERVQDEIKSALDEMQKIDKDFKIISWKDSATYSVFTYDPEKRSLPASTADITKYFLGYKPNIPKKFENLPKQNRTVTYYLSIRVHHPNNTIDKFEQDMSVWANVNSKRFKRTIIQTESPKNIGWFLYSSNYTDTHRLTKILEKETGYEWGFRISPVTSKDQMIGKKPNPYKNRIKALTAVVDLKNSVTAPVFALERFQNKCYTSANPLCTFEDRLMFVKPEKESESNATNAEAFAKMIDRQKMHQDELEAVFYPWITCNIDKKVFYSSQSTGKVSLRQLVLSIPKQQQFDEGEEPYFEPLFQGFDFTSNSSDKWYDGARGPGGSGYTFSFYKGNAGPAQQMITGIGIHLATLEPKNCKRLATSFSPEHWKASKGWAWSMKDNDFITKETTILLQNLLHDTNRAMVRASDEKLMKEAQDKEAKEKAAKEKKKLEQEHLKSIQKQAEARKKDKTYLAAAKMLENTKQKPVTDAPIIDSSDMLRLQVESARKKQYNDDGGSIDYDAFAKGTLKEKIVESIEMANDNESTTSSLTAHSLSSMVPLEEEKKYDPNDDDDDESLSSNQSMESATSSLKSLNEQFFDNFVKKAKLDNKDLTAEQVTSMAEQALMMQVKKALMKGGKLIHAKVQEEFNEKPPSSNNVATSDPPCPDVDKAADGDTAEEHKLSTPIKNNASSANTNAGVGDQK